MPLFRPPCTRKDSTEYRGILSLDKIHIEPRLYIYVVQSNYENAQFLLCPCTPRHNNPGRFSCYCISPKLSQYFWLPNFDIFWKLSDFMCVGHTAGPGPRKSRGLKGVSWKPLPRLLVWNILPIAHHSNIEGVKTGNQFIGAGIRCMICVIFSRVTTKNSKIKEWEIAEKRVFCIFGFHPF